MTLVSLLFLASFISAAQIESAIPARPTPPRLVNDFSDRTNGQAGFLTTEEKQALERKLVAYDDSTSNQVAIVIVDELQGYAVNEYAYTLGRKWGVGNKEFNNGMVILVNTGKKDGQRKVFIATGYGLEGVVPDVVASEIYQNILVPNFRAGNYYKGLDEAVDNIIAAAAGRYTAPEGYSQRAKKDSRISIFTIIIIIFIVFIFLSIISKKGGGGGGGYVSRRGYTDDWGRGGLPWIIGSGGSGWGNRGGGGWSGGGGGGGFGGFGGGSFGGGGAGGSW